MLWNEIKTNRDIKIFLEKTNGLHDGYIISVQYINGGIDREEIGWYFDSNLTKLMIQILVTSLGDTVVEMEFDRILEFQIRDRITEILDADVGFDRNRNIIWATEFFYNTDDFKECSYVIAGFMRWRVIERTRHREKETENESTSMTAEN